MHLNRLFHAPIVFIQYGDAPYLKHVLRSALATNPDKRVILVGDHRNRCYQLLGIDHVSYADYQRSSEHLRFVERFRTASGAGDRASLLNLERWFILHELARRHDVAALWHFDTETMFAASLRDDEKELLLYDGSETSDGRLRGLVPRTTLDRYVEQIIAGARDEATPTEAGTFARFKREGAARIIGFDAVLDNAYHDEAITKPGEMEPYNIARTGRELKKLFFGPAGSVFTYHVPSAQFMRVLTMGMRYTPAFLHRRISIHVRDADHRALHRRVEPNMLHVMPCEEGAAQQIGQAVGRRARELMQSVYAALTVKRLPYTAEAVEVSRPGALEVPQADERM